MNPSHLSLEDLVQPMGGLFTGSAVGRPSADGIRVIHRSVQLGNVGAVWPNSDVRGIATMSLPAGGSGLGTKDSLTPALAEGVERYSTGCFDDRQITFASAAELGDRALDLLSIPQCSRTERHHSRYPLNDVNSSLPIRWVKGISLHSMKECFIPAVMVYSHLGNLSAAERFWLPNSTGCASHVTFQAAALAAIYEVIERDAISLIWLQRLRLPEIEIDTVDEELGKYLKLLGRALGVFQYRFFDATLDLQAPTVFGVQVAPYNHEVTTLVACSTKSSLSEAICKVIRDLSGLRTLIERTKEPPQSWDDFHEPVHGARYMASSSRSGAFHFLTNSPERRRLSSISQPLTGINALKEILKKLLDQQIEVYALDISTDEAIRSGLRVVRVVIPRLQPLSFRYRARFLGHPRIYEVPSRLGYRTYREEELNAYPQPFA